MSRHLRGCSWVTAIVLASAYCAWSALVPPFGLAAPRQEERVRNTVHFDAKLARVVMPATQTQYVCSILGLGEYGSVPFNFPGADSASLASRRNQLPRITEDSLPAGGNALTARVFAGDMGWPFEHSDGYVYFAFDDALFPPESARSACPADVMSCAQTTWNDDMLARSDPSDWASNPECIALDIERAPGAAEFLPITVNGPVPTGGISTGPGIVPGPGFSSGRFIFLLMPLPLAPCDPGTDDCAARSMVHGDRCLQSPAGGAYCHFGPCEGDEPCALRLQPSTLVVRSERSNFVTPRVGEHISSSAVLEAYRGHFATVAFQADVDPQTHTGVISVLGRDSFWGTPGLAMNPYLMFHPVENGVLREPQYFSGMSVDGEPMFTSNADAAVQLYADSVPLPHHTSLAFVPELDGGTWIMIYGGHAQANLRNNLNVFARPLPDSLFYDREAGVVLRWARAPWGPWSEPRLIFNPYVRGQGGYCEQMHFDDPHGKTGFVCPSERTEHNSKLNRMPGTGLAGEYGAAIIPRSFQPAANGGASSFRWLLSTWNPYRVIVLRTDIRAPLESVAPLMPR